MKKRILSLLLVICMIASYLPVIALADSTTWKSSMHVTVKNYSKVDMTVNAENPVKYLVIEEDVAVAKTTEVAGWLVKMDFNATGNPTMTLNGVTATEIAGHTTYNTAPLDVVLVGDNVLESASGLSANNKDITISGTGTLTINNTGTGINAGTGNLIIDGATVDVNGGFYGVTAATVVVESGVLDVSTSRSGRAAMNVDNTVVKGGTLIASSVDVGALKGTLDLSQYIGDYNAVVSNFSGGYDAWTDGLHTARKFFKIEPVTGGGEGGGEGDDTPVVPVPTWKSSMNVTVKNYSKVDMTVTAESPVKYLVIEGGVAVAKTSEVAGWLVKMDFNAAGNPTMTLNGVTATEIAGHTTYNTAPLDVVLVGENVLESASALSANNQNISISGSGKLTINNTGTGINAGTGTLTVKEATLDVNTAFYGVTAATVVVESGVLDVSTTAGGRNAMNVDNTVVKGGTLIASSVDVGALKGTLDLSQYIGDYNAVVSNFSGGYDAWTDGLHTARKYFKIQEIVEHDCNYVDGSCTVCGDTPAGVTITKQPVSASAVNGQTVKVTFTATGDGLTYKWYYKDANATDFALTTSFTSNSYTTTMNDARNGRQIYCVVTDKYGNSVQTETVTISMKTALVITQQPTDVVVENGASAIVSFTARSYSAYTGEGLTYKWYFKDAGASKFTLTTSFKSNSYKVAMTAARSGRQLYCVVTDKYGNSVQTNTVTLGMKVSVSKQPMSVSVANGATAKVTVTAAGDGLTYQWYYKDKTASEFALTTTFKGNSYSAQMNAARNGRQLYCVITDKYGNTVTTQTVTIRIKSTITITKQPATVVVANGKTAKVTFTATGEGLTYKWYFKDKTASKFALTTTFKGNSYSAMMNAARSGRQLYCVVTDKYGNTVTTNTVTIAVKATVTKQPLNVSVASGKAATVSLTAIGEGLTYKWYFKDAGASKFSLTTSFTGNSYKVAMNAARSGRQLYCVVTDKYGNVVQTNTVTISMK